MGNTNFEHDVQERAYYKFLNRMNNHLPENTFQDWEEAEREQLIYDRIKEEAFYHSLHNGQDPAYNWMVAEQEINQRIGFLAFYMHESNYNRSPEENWIDAQRLYIHEY